MDQEVIQCERSGVNPKWPSYKSVLGRIAKGPHVSDEYELNGIREYVERGDAFAKPSTPVPNSDNVTRSSSEWMAVTRAHKVLATAPDNPQWLLKLAHWLRVTATLGKPAKRARRIPTTQSGLALGARAGGNSLYPAPAPVGRFSQSAED